MIRLLSHFARIVAIAAALLIPPASLFAVAPDEAVKQFRVADGFEISLVAAEPEIRQPVAMNFDERGRLWVVQYLQYPDPAGLKKVAVDQYMRTRFDRVPEPPPKGPRGADRITICEDTNGDGRMDKFKDFVAGLNMATGVTVGYGGVFLAQSPYLLFYPDKNRDDVPDGDPEVLVAGFGMEDSHAYPNSLQIGPDGWLYGAQGSNVWAKVEVEVGANGDTYIPANGPRGLGLGAGGRPKNEERIANQGAKDEGPKSKAPVPSPESPAPHLRPRRTLEFNQCVWRYHPPTRRFEVFAEGGGNTWSLDFDRHGEIICGTNFGGVVGLHMVQGGYYVKGFAKHGPLSNPHAYGYFEHMPYASPAKISQGEHVMCGGIVYQGGAFGPQIEDQYITCALLHRAIYWHKLIPDRSTYKSDFGGTLVSTDDPEFRPVDLALAPDGSVYVADWCDVRANHVIPEDTWNKTNGRIYRLAKKGTPRVAAFDLAKKSSTELIKLLEHPNVWYRREAVRLLGERGDRESLPALQGQIETNASPAQTLAALWAVARISPLDKQQVAELLVHPNEDIRAWTVRLVGDSLDEQVRHGGYLDALAEKEPGKRVRSQLASTARRVDPEASASICQRLIKRDEDADDPRIGLLIWWAVEADLSRRSPDALNIATTRLFDDPAAWSAPMVRRHLTERIARRITAEGRDQALDVCAKLLASAATDADRILVLRGIEAGFAGKPSARLPRALESALALVWKRGSPSLQLVRTSLKLGSEQAYHEALSRAGNVKTPEAERLEMLGAVSQSSRNEGSEALLKLVTEDPSDAVRAAALSALSRFSDDAIAERLLAAAGTMKPPLKAQTLSLLAARKTSAAALLDGVAHQRIPAKDITTDLVETIREHKNAELDAMVEKYIGRFQSQTSAEKQTQIGRVADLLAAAPGDAARGKPLFTKHCGTCHTLNGEGAKIGPDLTTADRGSRTFLLSNIIDPSLGIRQEYSASVVRTASGQVITGIVTDRQPAGITLVDAKNVQHRVATDEIDEIKASPISLMPEKILDPLPEGEVRDLFAYLESGVKRTTDRRRLVAEFDQGIGDWTVADNGSRARPEHRASGGNGGGWIIVRDGSGGNMRLVAPTAFHGDLSNLSGGMAWFDAKAIDRQQIETAGGKPHPVFGMLEISNGQQTIKQDLFHPTEQVPTGEWLRFSGRMTPDAFGTDAATFKAVLSNVKSITITIEAFANAQEAIGVDNVTLQAK